MGILNRPLVFDSSCAIPRYKNTTRGAAIPDMSDISVVDGATVTYNNRAGVAQPLTIHRSCIDWVTDHIGVLHIDMYVDAIRAERDKISFNSQLVLK